MIFNFLPQIKKEGDSKLKYRSDQGGYLIILVLVFGAVFFTIFTAFIGYTVTQKKISTVKNAQEQAVQIAEAGLEYYKWFLAHNPDDITNATTSPQPYVIPYLDPEGAAQGEYSLEVDGNLACGEVTSIDITSTGHAYSHPDQKRTIYARYARPNVGEYSHIVNANVWAGDDREIYGPYHSNGFVRMDGSNNSKVTSGQTSGTCNNIDVCSSPYSSWSTVDGVFGAGPNSGLWTWGMPPINFSGITVDLNTMLDKAKNGGGLWFGPSSTGSGYYVVFNSNGTFTLREIKQSKAKGNAWGHHKNFLNNATLVGTYTIPTDCSVLFFEDNVWVEGAINGRVTAAAARPTASANPTVTLIGNLTYANDDSGLLLIGEQDIHIGLNVPDDMEINGIFMAQNGQFIRPHFTTGSCGSTTPCFSIQNSMDDYIKRDTLTTHGTVVSNGRVGTKWSSGSTWISGFGERYDYYDRDLAIDPPPLTPKTSDDYQFIEWREGE